MRTNVLTRKLRDVDAIDGPAGSVIESEPMLALAPSPDESEAA